MEQREAQRITVLQAPCWLCACAALRRLGSVLGWCGVAYFGLALLVFDWGSRAQQDTREFSPDRREVYIGPAPRFRWPDSAGGYDPDLWEFRLFQPLCAAWRRAHGYAAPAPDVVVVQNGKMWLETDESRRPAW